MFQRVRLSARRARRRTCVAATGASRDSSWTLTTTCVTVSTPHNLTHSRAFILIVFNIPKSFHLSKPRTRLFSLTNSSVVWGKIVFSVVWISVYP